MQARTRMMRTGLLLAICLLASLLAAARAQALGLGEITLSSSLNEPLDATLELLDVAGLDASQIQIALGTQGDFAQAGLERTVLLSGIRFAVETEPNGTTGTVRLTTTANISEPFLVFIVSASWPNGRQLREYTLLLDLPTFSNTPAAPTQAAVASNTPASTEPALINETPRQATPADAAASAESSYQVNAGDTLWEIAQSTRPDGSISVQQMMVAIQRANEDAFIGSNINQLRSGRVLRIPSLQEIAVIEQDAANAQINQQNSTLGGQPLAVNTTDASGGAPAEQDELTLLSGNQNISTGGSSDLAATIAALETELMLSEENLDRARLENLELTNRLASLEEEIDLLRNIIAIEDQRIAQLQSELAQQTAASAQALAQLQTSQSTVPGAPAGLGGLLQNSAVLIGSLLALVLAALGVLVVRRRRAEAEADMHAYNPAVNPSLNPAMPAASQQEFADAEPAPSFLAGLFARFRRPKDEAETEDHFDDFDDGQGDGQGDYFEDADSTPPAGTVTASSASKPKQSAEELFSEMGLEDDLSSLDNILDDIDETDTPVHDESEAEEIVLAVTPAEEPAAPEVATAPETFEFNLRDVPSAPAVEEISPDDVEAEVEAFEFTPQAPISTVGVDTDDVVESDSYEPEVEVISFDTSVPPAPASTDVEELIFDDSMLADEEDDDQHYMSRDGKDAIDRQLDLATAFEAMGDLDDALEILEEVIAEGSPAQVELAKRLQQSWRSA